VSDSPLSNALLEWYQKNARNLPWRDQKPDPYRIWISEIMLQQTRVDSVIPYFYRWMEHFPNLDDLAAASQQEVLGVWEGLGYYSRARNLHDTAQIIQKRWGGRLPENVTELKQLPGIGEYTAAAIASFAYNADEAVLDGNVRRVLSRVFDIDLPMRSPAGEKRLWQIAQENLPHGRSGAYNQALMDMGSMICTPRQPKCTDCPLRGFCLAYAWNIQEKRPVPVKRPAIPHYQVTAAVICCKERVLIAQRPAKGLLGGLWEFPGGKLLPGEDLVACLKREIQEELGVPIHVHEQLGKYKHAYTHFRVTLHAFVCSLLDGAQPHPMQVQDLCWVMPEKLSSYPMGKIDRLITRDLQSRQENLC